uniref:Non-specific protein-tyrosine kinase n=1 Tax=Bursaphelenchus xylophilus TaxID=6326 RepID=A0A1I7SPK0_BURXY
IADFGLSRKQTDPEVIKGRFRAPIRLMAPETIGKHPKFSNRSDVWAFGMLLWEIFTNGDVAWPDDPPKAIAHFIKALEMPVFPRKIFENIFFRFFVYKIKKKIF